MGKPKAFENYPCQTIMVSNSVSVSIYLIGAAILYRLGILWTALYLFYILALEIRQLKSCANCYYHGKYCAFGKGKLSAVFFRKGSPKKFSKGKITWKALIPDILVSLIPLVAGVTLLIMDFSWLILLLLILLVILTSKGNEFVRGSLACKFCKQREIGCPAEQLFHRGKKAKK